MWNSEIAKLFPSMYPQIMMEFGMKAGSQKEVMDAWNKFPMSLQKIETQLKNKTYILGDHMSTADIHLASILFSRRSMFVAATAMKRLPNIQKWHTNMTSKSWWTRLFGKSFAPSPPFKVPEQDAVNSYMNDPENNPVNKAAKMQGLKAPTTQSATTEEPKKLTGKAAVQAKLAADKEKADEKKKEKKVIIAKSIVAFDVKGYEVGQDYEAMAQKIKAEVKMDGLVWMDQHKILPIAFGMQKLQMSMLIEDDKVQTEDVFEQIEAWEDDVQSCDIFTFAKA